MSSDGRILDGGRSKAYRPLAEAERRRAFEGALAAYDRGDFFAAHELLEPAWMGSADVRERSLCQGLIKLAAGYVHAVRGNPLGMRKNLVGARERLARAAGGGSTGGVGESGDQGGTAGAIDLAALLDAIDDRISRLIALEQGGLEAPALLVLLPPPSVQRIPIPPR